MSSCELCGSSSDSLKNVKIEGTKLKVCESCASMGEELGGSKQKRKKTSSSRSSKSRQESQVLVPNYGETIKNARESEGISLRDLADELNEKKSLLSKVEKGDMKPGKSLAKKLSKKLNIDLYTNPKVADPGSTDNVDSRSATMEDVADIS